jgi:hypothetical protein
MTLRKLITYRYRAIKPGFVFRQVRLTTQYPALLMYQRASITPDISSTLQVMVGMGSIIKTGYTYAL